MFKPRLLLRPKQVTSLNTIMQVKEAYKGLHELLAFSLDSDQAFFG
jgi:hypothetical protein